MKSVPAGTLFFKPMKEPPAGTTIEWVDNIIVGMNAPNQSGYAMVRNGVVESEAIKSPFSPGEKCYVREGYALNHDLPADIKREIVPAIWPPDKVGEPVGPFVWYKADGCKGSFAGKWRSPATMPQWAARRFVTVLSCEPVRVSEVTEEDAIKMGAYWWHPVDDFIEHWRKRHPGKEWAWLTKTKEEK